MARIKCQKDGQWFEVEIGRNTVGPVYEPGSLLLYGCPFPDIPLQLGISITPAGEVLFRHWEFCTNTQQDMQIDPCVSDICLTLEMATVVRQLWEGTLRFGGIRLALHHHERQRPIIDQCIRMSCATYTADYLLVAGT